MILKVIKRLILGLFCIVFLSSLGLAQTEGDVTRTMREELAKSVQRFVKMGSRGELSAMFEVLAAEQRRHYKSTEDFVELQQKREDLSRRQLVKFKISSIDRYLTSTDYYVVGCGEYRVGKKREFIESHVFAVYEEGSWRFRSFVGPVLSVGSQVTRGCEDR